MKVSMRQLEAFSAVMTLKTATAAAAMLHTSQPTITRLLKQLEYATGLELFNRVKGKLEPTEEAYVFINTVTENFHGMSRIGQAAKEIHSRKAGYLRIACLPAFSQGFLARATADFLKNNPAASISILPLLSSGVTNAIVTHKIDIGIAAYKVENNALQGSEFTHCNEVVVMRTSSPLRRKKKVVINDLSGQRIVRLVEKDPYRHRLDLVLASNNIAPDNIIETQTSASVCAMVTQGVGIAIVNPLTALDFVDSGLVMRDFSFKLPFVTTLLIASTFIELGLTEAFVKTLTRRRDVDLQLARELCARKY